MPRTGLPPTPATSTDILGKENARISSLEMSFTLPPPAIMSAASKSRCSSTTSVKSDSSYRPASPSSPKVKSSHQKHGRLSSAQPPATVVVISDCSLPPPPTRSRKIIQMKPGSNTKVHHGGSNAGFKAVDKKLGVSQGPTATNKKLPSSTSVAGRKIARKTAHSLIERRRRSKMNEEFDVLKNMIPACTGQEMHKLAILQASIDYLRYLEQCVTDLKASNSSKLSSAHHRSQAPTSQLTSSVSLDEGDSSDDEDQDLDMEMEMESTHPAPVYNVTARSPVIVSHSKQQASSSSVTSSLPSPVFPPQYHQHSYQQYYSVPYGPDHAFPTEISPALLPRGMRDVDHEATAALLMLNTERRNPDGGRDAGRGMSVKDLLST